MPMKLEVMMLQPSIIPEVIGLLTILLLSLSPIPLDLLTIHHTCSNFFMLLGTDDDGGGGGGGGIPPLTLTTSRRLPMRLILKGTFPAFMLWLANI